jgi:hypothetical protein
MARDLDRGEAAAPEKVASDGGENQSNEDSPLMERFYGWVQTEFVWYAGSFSFHLLGLAALLLLGSVAAKAVLDDAPVYEQTRLEEPTADKPPPQFTKLVLPPAPNVPDEPTPSIARPTGSDGTEIQLPPEIVGPLRLVPPDTENADRNQVGISSIGSFSVNGFGNPAGPRTADANRAGNPLRPGEEGSGWPGNPFGPRVNGGHALIAGGGNPDIQHAVTRAIVWLANHQSPDGSWSLQGYHRMCRSGDATCTCPGDVHSDTGATALGLLPFLGAGYTHKTGPYQSQVGRGLRWLISRQKPDGDLRGGSTMYAHGLATIALCEAYGMTRDQEIGRAAKIAVDFILTAQNKNTGGWRYQPGEEGDTSVVGWQIMALKSAQMAGLIPPSGSTAGGAALESAGKYLDLVAKGPAKSQFSYQPNDKASQTMTAVGLLCRQYLGASSDDSLMVEGTRYLMSNMPGEDRRDVYYWYYATQVMHNMINSDWDQWNRKMWKILVHSQHNNGYDCANGSWDPEKPMRDAWGSRGGRVMMTSLACLTLEVYYRHLPLYRLNGRETLKTLEPPQL